MKDGFIKVGAASNDLVVANPIYNAKKIINKIKDASKKNVKLVVFPELSISGATCGDLFFQDTLLNDSLVALDQIRRATLRRNMLVVVGLPLKHNNKIYNVAAYLNKGKILGFISKTHLSNDDNRYFASLNENEEVIINSNKYFIGPKLLFKCLEINELIVSSEIGEDILNPLAPSSFHALNGATIILNLSASNEVSGKEKERLEVVKMQSFKTISGYIYSNASINESTQDVVYSAHNIIVENGEVLISKNNFKNNMIISEIDVKRLAYIRSKNVAFNSILNDKYEVIYFNLKLEEEELTRRFP